MKRVRERVERRVGQQEIEREATRDRERKRELGDILTSNFYALRKGMKSACLTDYYDPEGRETEIPLDPAADAPAECGEILQRVQQGQNGGSGAGRTDREGAPGAGISGQRSGGRCAGGGQSGI